jgi:hypothetical protein
MPPKKPQIKAGTKDPGNSVATIKSDRRTWREDSCMYYAVFLFLLLAVVSYAVAPPNTQGPAAGLPTDEFLKSDAGGALIGYRFASHEESRRELRGNLKYQSLLLAVALVILAKGVRSVEKEGMNILNVNVPPVLLIAVEIMLPIAMLELWIEFGYQLFDLIENHHVLYDMILQRESILGVATSTWGMKPLLSDHFFALDLWCLVFDEKYIAIERGFWLKPLKFLVTSGFITFFALYEGTMLALVTESYHARGRGKLVRFGYFAYVTFLVFILFSSWGEFNYASGGALKYHGPTLTLGLAAAVTWLLAKGLPFRSRDLAGATTANASAGFSV